MRDSTRSGVLGDDAIQPAHEARTWRRVALEVDGMGEPSTDVSAKKPDPNADIVTTRVNVAFPFSQIRIQEPSEDLAALADLVRDLADLLADVAGGSQGAELRTRAQDLATRLR